jgi:hypothetical protein
MKHTVTITTWLIGILLSGVTCYGQGCSDAGFCTLGTLKQGADSVSWKQKITFLSPIGVGDEGVMVITPALQYDLSLSPRWTVQAKVTGNYADGNLGTATGAGDVFLTATYATIRHRLWKKSWLLGGKVPLNNGNITASGRSLPMQYQSSLGTVDLIAGATINNRRWQFSIAWQQPLSGSNSNNFLPADWDNPDAAAYPATNDFNRKGDILLRASHTFLPDRAITITPGLLGIYHLGEDTYADPSNHDKVIQIEGSQGLTLNVTAVVLWKVKDKLRIGITGGAPVIARDARPDGLTRKFVLAPEIQWTLN